ncbi:hypothetical protein F5887DRAFT_923743 [Amanita rubescens]|nr:hypothetical protein F5887DRAFT_923743 [Amanita rubescens]
MIPSVPVPLSLSTYCQKLLHVIKLNRHITPVLPDGKRVPPDELCLYRQTHQYIGPGCLCPLLEPLTAHKEAAIYLAVNGYPGEYVAECADDRCGYLVPLERIYPRRRVPGKAYPLRDVSMPCPPVVFSKNEVRADVEGPCLTEVFAQEVEPADTTRPLKRTHAEASLLNPPFPALKRRRTLTDWRRFPKVGSFHRPGLAEEEFLGLFVQCDVCKLIVVHRSFYNHSSAALGPSIMEPVYRQTDCANIVKLTIPIERIYPKNGVFFKTYPLRGTPCPPQVFTEREVKGIAVGQLKRTYAPVGMLDPPFPAPGFEGMDLCLRTDWWNLWQLELKEKPGLTEDQFLGLPQTTDESGSDSD